MKAKHLTRFFSTEIPLFAKGNRFPDVGIATLPSQILSAPLSTHYTNDAVLAIIPGVILPGHWDNEQDRLNWEATPGLSGCKQQLLDYADNLYEPLARMGTELIVISSGNNEFFDLQEELEVQRELKLPFKIAIIPQMFKSSLADAGYPVKQVEMHDGDDAYQLQVLTRQSFHLSRGNIIQQHFAYADDQIPSHDAKRILAEVEVAHHSQQHATLASKQ